MIDPWSARTFWTCARGLLGAALLGTIVLAGCGSDAASAIGDAPTSGNDLDATAPNGLDPTIATNGDGSPSGDLDASSAGLLDGSGPADAKFAADGKAVTYVSLKTAGSFVVLAGQTITNTGFTVINGNVGISPGAAITGFPPGIVNGTVHSADAVAAQAKQDLNDAYGDAASRSGAPIPISGDLGGQTLVPGLYVSGTSLGLDSGDLTLDAKGDEDAIWVFQIGTTFVSKPNRNVLLTGNARADNVFWNVGSSATIGVGSVMAGNFLTQVSITVQTGAVMEGRFLTQVGAVTFDSATVNRPKPVH